MPSSMECKMGEDCVGYHADGQATTFTKECWCDMTWSLKGQGWLQDGKKRWTCRRCCDAWGPDYSYDKMKVWNKDYQCQRCTPHAFGRAPPANAPQAAARPQWRPVPPRQVEQRGVARGSGAGAAPRAASPPPPPPPGLPPAAEPGPEPTPPTSAASSAAGGEDMGAPSTETPSATIPSCHQGCQTEEKVYETRSTSISGEYFATQELEASFAFFTPVADPLLDPVRPPQSWVYHDGSTLL